MRNMLLLFEMTESKPVKLETSCTIILPPLSECSLSGFFKSMVLVTRTKRK